MRARYLVMILAIGAAACSSSDTGTATPQAQAATPGTQASTPAANRSDLRFLADDLPMLPEGVHTGARPPEVIRASYLFAARHPEVLKYIPCFCACERAGHKGNHDCFVANRDAGGKVRAWDMHGIGCPICIDVAYESMQMFNSGASVTAIRAAIDRNWTGQGHGLTPTPSPVRRGTSQ
jgi:Protein of unknown function with PCYCGC motif